MPTLEDAIALAIEANRGQKDRVGEPYILHPLRVMFRLGWDAPEAARIAAVLHDVVEKFIERVLPNPIARMVKRADLVDNMELRRLPGLTENDLERLSRYRSAWARIVSAD